MPHRDRRRSPLHWLQNRCLPLLVALVFLIFMAPMFDGRSSLSEAVYPALLAGVPFLGVMLLSARIWTLALAIVGGLAVTVIVYFAKGNPEQALASVAAPLMILFYVLAIIAIARSVFGGRALLDDRIYGGIAVYLLVGVAFAVVHNTISFNDPTAYRFLASHDANPVLDWGDALYFSFISLTTLGYGEIVPAHGFARSAVLMEGMAGVFMPAIFIARLAALPRNAQ